LGWLMNDNDRMTLNLIVEYNRCIDKMIRIRNDLDEFLISGECRAFRGDVYVELTSEMSALHEKAEKIMCELKKDSSST
jgi:hypothetical protein